MSNLTLIALVCFFGALAFALFAWRAGAQETKKKSQERLHRRSKPKRESPRTKAPKPTPSAPAASSPRPPAAIPRLHLDDDDDEDELTRMTLSRVVPSKTEPIVWDEDAAEDEPTGAAPWLLLSASGQTDRGRKRRKNEDSFLEMPEAGVFVVADGMGGHVGGEVASATAVGTIEKAFLSGEFAGAPYPNVPPRASELAQAIHSANVEIFQRAKDDPSLEGMGTTIVAARFMPRKQRLYVGHVGDSRCYRLRGGELSQMTTDHTMAEAGMKGPMAGHLTRSLGIGPTVEIDMVIAKPYAKDVYLICSDGLFKMTNEQEICEAMMNGTDIREVAKGLIDLANERGGKDNVTVLLVEVHSPRANR